MLRLVLSGGDVNRHAANGVDGGALRGRGPIFPMDVMMVVGVAGRVLMTVSHDVTRSMFSVGS